LTQVHGCEVVVLRREDGRRGMGGDWPEADILVCDDPGVAVAVQVADCVPLLLADPRTQAVAAAHAGWRGMAASVPRVTVDALRRAFGVRAADLVAAAGPSIGPCCCEVGADVREAFDTAGQAPDAIGRWFRPAGGAGLDLARRPGHTFLDLWAATREQLMAAGLDEANIHLSRVCSVCQVSRCWSYRRDGAGTGRMVGVIRSGPLRP